MDKLLTILYRKPYSLLYLLPFLGVIGVAGYNLYKALEPLSAYTWATMVRKQTVTDSWYILIALVYFVCVFCPKFDDQQKKMAMRICIWVLCLSYFIIQNLIS